MDNEQEANEKECKERGYHERSYFITCDNCGINNPDKYQHFRTGEIIEVSKKV